MACMTDKLKVVNLLVNYKADINKKGPKDLGGFTPLHICAQNDAWHCAEFLLECKAEVDAPSESKSTPLIEAAKFGSKHFTTVIFGFKPDGEAVDANGMSANYYAGKAGFYDLAKRLPVVPFDEWANLQKDPKFAAMQAASKDSKGGKKKKKKKK
jgi:hypothetical protein